MTASSRPPGAPAPEVVRRDLAEQISQSVDERKAKMVTGALLAVERAMFGWVRTGIALMVLGFMLVRFDLLFAHTAPRGQAPSLLTSPLVGAAVITQGAAVCIWAAARYVRSYRAVQSGETGLPDATGPMVVALGTIVMAFVLAAMVWTLGRAPLR